MSSSGKKPHCRKKKRRAERKRKKKHRERLEFIESVVDDIDDIEVSGEEVSSDEFRQLKFLWENKEKIYRNRKIIRLLG